MEIEEQRIARRILTGARDLIGEESAWVQGPMARNRRGHSVASTSPDACQWCCLGAIEKTLATMIRSERSELLDELTHKGWDVAHDAKEILRDVINDYTDSLFEGDIGDFNDSGFTHHADVIHVLNEALFQLEGEADV